MLLYTIVNDRKLWKNSLRSELLSKVEYSDEQVNEFRKSISGYILKDVYSWVSDGDYEESHGGSTYYHQIKDSWMLICEGKVVGVIFITSHYSHAMSNVKDYKYSALFFDEPNEKARELWYSSYELYYNTTRDEDTCRVSIVKESEKPDYYSLKNFPINNIIN
ncbi:MAG: hypothetical protein J6B29_02005 [Clostridia bacterium]|nr:hypothetical protein [Clostridia bacterium]